MKIPTKGKEIDINEINSKLKERFPEYDVHKRSSNLIVVKKTATTGAMISVRKRNLIVAGNFPTIGGQVIFMICLVFGAILLTTILYFIFFHGKMKKLEREITHFLMDEYGL